MTMDDSFGCVVINAIITNLKNAYLLLQYKVADLMMYIVQYKIISYIICDYYRYLMVDFIGKCLMDSNNNYINFVQYSVKLKYCQI